MTRKKANRGKPGPKPGFMPAVNLKRAQMRAEAKAAAPVVTDDDAAYIAQVRKDPIRGSKDLRTMDHARMKLYAKGLDIPQHNIDALTLERLRQNCQMKVATIIEALTE